MRHLLFPPLLAVALAWHPAPAAAQLDGAIPDARVAQGTLSFDGYATVGDFTGTTKEVRGELTGADSLRAVRGWVEAPVKSLDTGDRKRDRDLNRSMESDKYPVMRFELDSVLPEQATAERATVALAGRMTLHGVTREVTLPAEVRAVDGGFRLTSDFPLNVKDYGIGGLTRMLGLLRMQENIDVHVDLTFAPG